MHRLLVATELLKDASPCLPREAARHLKVLRPESGEPIELFDGRGRTRVYRYDAAARGLANPEALVERPAPAKSLTLFACITKGSRWDWTIEKATELGVTRIVPVISERTIVRIPPADREAKRERWLRIAEDAARQSDSVWLPEILPAVDFPAALAMVRETTCFVGALTNPPSQPLAAAVKSVGTDPRFVGTDPNKCATFIGPEGDFTQKELEELLKIAIPTSFGNTILRAETAAIYAVSVIRAMTDCV